MHSWLKLKHLCFHCSLTNQNELNKDYIKTIKNEISSWWMGTKSWISHLANATTNLPLRLTTNKNLMQTLFTVPRDTNSAELQQRLSVSASVSAKVPYYGDLQQNKTAEATRLHKSWSLKEECSCILTANFSEKNKYA